MTYHTFRTLANTTAILLTFIGGLAMWQTTGIIQALASISFSLGSITLFAHIMAQATADNNLDAYTSA